MLLSLHEEDIYMLKLFYITSIFLPLHHAEFAGMFMTDFYTELHVPS
jgi:hypothetical protein